MTVLPKCTQCNSEFTYEDGDDYICPECAHEWSKKAFSSVLVDGDHDMDCK